MGEWIHGTPARAALCAGLVARPLQLWLDDGSVRHAQLSPLSISWLVFTDCTHPQQNVLCDAGRIQAWRLAQQ